jgi:hypothetical protein
MYITNIRIVTTILAVAEKCCYREVEFVRKSYFGEYFDTVFAKIILPFRGF